MSSRLNRLVATVGGIGYLPLAPGTWAAAVATIIWYLLFRENNIGGPWQIILALAAILTGIYCSGKVAGITDKDPSHVVIDEVAGMWISLILIPVSIQNYIAGFILFRIFDIAKPLGIRKMENQKGGLGIMLDDVLAGVYSNAILRIIILLKIW